MFAPMALHRPQWHQGTRAGSEMVSSGIGGDGMAVFDLKGRVALVTGGNGGIGLGMARGLAQAGAAIAIAARNVKKAETAAAELAKLGAKTAVLAVDVAQEAQCRKMVADTVAQLGRLD